jgi:hypothetical protein
VDATIAGAVVVATWVFAADSSSDWAASGAVPRVIVLRASTLRRERAAAPET